MTIDLGFDADVPLNGYRWWYVDGISDDGRHSLTLIAFIGSVFSPFYFSARQRGDADPRNHICMNVVLTGDRPNRWCFTEHNHTALSQGSSVIGIGDSSLTWTGDHLVLDLNEVTCPWPGSVRGQVIVRPSAVGTKTYSLDGEGRHTWRPIAPLSRLEVQLTEPALNWSGEGYFDSNWGSRALEDDFTGWTWSQAGDAQQKQIFYDVQRRDGSEQGLALKWREDGTTEDVAPPTFQKLTRGAWRMPRHIRSEDPAVTRVTDTLLDAPFYTRSCVQSRLDGHTMRGTHESLSLDLFRSWWVQGMLPFRSRRV